MRISNAAFASGSACSGDVALAGLHVVEDRVAMAEGAALDVFASQANGDAVGENRRKRQFLGRRPVDRALVERVEHRLTALACPIQLAVLGEALGTRQQRHVERAQAIGADRRLHLPGRPGRRRLGNRFDQIGFGLERDQRLLEDREVLARQRVHLRRSQLAAFDEAIRPDFAHRGVPGDLLVEPRLGEARLVAFVVPVAPVADQIDEEVTTELAPIGRRQSRRFDARLGIVGVDVDDGNLEAARHVARVQRAVATRVTWP